MTREEFENAAYGGFVDHMRGDPVGRSEFLRTLRRSVPVMPDSLRQHNSDFRPTARECGVYNATFYATEPLEFLELAVKWERGWKTYEVTGTRHAYYLLLKLADRDGFQGARLNTPVTTDAGYRLDDVMSLSEDDILGSDRHGKFACLLDRNNTHYDLEA